MALEIIVAAEMENFLGESSAIPSPPTVPPAPPMPKNWGCKLHQLPLTDADSGNVSLHSDLQLPGQELSDSEFSEEFSSAFSSRRSSNSQSDFPPPPPLPPIPAYLRDLPTVIAEQPSPRLRLPRRMLQGIVIDENLYDVYTDDDEDEESYWDDGEEDLSCIVCFDSSGKTFGNSTKRRCCKKRVCPECIAAIVQTNINEGIAHIKCPNPDCDGYIHRQEIIGKLSDEDKSKYERMMLELEGDGSKRVCPNCCFITEYKLPQRLGNRYKEKDVRLTCVKCDQDWCFNCRTPWKTHEGMSCKKYQKGNRQFVTWTKERTRTGVANCQKCPMCRVFIQRSTGCDHMTCNRCSTHFCYKCGNRFLEIPGLGDHYTRMSVLGCQNNYKANEPAKRKAVRGGYLTAKLAMLTGYPFLFVAGVGVVVIVGAVALPIYGCYKLHKYNKNMRRMRRRRKH